MSRLWRLGQKETVNWEILYLQHSYNNWFENAQIRKFACLLEAEGLLSDQITGQFKRLYVFEIIRIHFGQRGKRGNRYPKEQVLAGRFDKPSIIRETELYSAITQYYITHPEKADEFNDEETIPRIVTV